MTWVEFLGQVIGRVKATRTAFPIASPAPAGNNPAIASLRAHSTPFTYVPASSFASLPYRSEQLRRP